MALCSRISHPARLFRIPSSICLSYKWRYVSSSTAPSSSSSSDDETVVHGFFSASADPMLQRTDSGGEAVSRQISDGIYSPVDATSACLDYFHNLTGLPWWATISISAIALRALLFPLRIIQEKKVEEIKKHAPKLKLELLARGVFQWRFLEEYRSLRSRRLELSSPNLLWMIGPGIFIQVPVVLMIMYTLRTMALDQHTGFSSGGMLWFENLTVPGAGIAGMVLPLTIASTYFANTHVLFQGRPVRPGPYGTFLKVWENMLKFSTCFIFLSFYHVPQATHMFFVPHSIMTLSQTLFFEHKKISPSLGRNQARARQDQIIDNTNNPAELSAYEKLLKDAGTHFSSGNSSKAIEVLMNAIKEEPEEDQAYALLGLVYKTRKDWVNSAFYYQNAILKGKTDDFKIAAHAGCGLALLKHGAVDKCIETMRAIRSFKVPLNPQTKHLYYASLIILGRALSEAGLNEEAQEVKALAQELNPDNTK